MRGFDMGRPKSRLLLCAMALGVLLASSASAQILEGQILLPDSLGPLTGKTHVAFDEIPSHPRMFIGGEDGNVLVMDAFTGKRLARISTGPVSALVYCPPRNKLYVATKDGNGVVVADCGSYEVIRQVPNPSPVTGLCYNPRTDRVYCAALPMKVIDCASDIVVDSLMVNGVGASCALDEAHNKLYVGAKDALKVIDCSFDSVAADIDEIQHTRALCFQPTAGKVYAAAGSHFSR